MTLLMKFAGAALLLLMLFFAAPQMTAGAQELDPTCSDGIDNDNDGLVDLEDPSCIGLSEEPAQTVAPTAEPTDVPTGSPITTEPATQEPTAAPTAVPTVTPSTVPDTGGDPGDGDTTGGAPNDLQFSEWLAQTSAIGIVTSFLVMIIGITGLAVTSTMKRVAAVVISVGLTVLYVAMKDNVSLSSMEDVFATALGVMVTSQVAYLLVTREIGERVAARK